MKNIFTDDFIRLLQQECGYEPQAENLRRLLQLGEVREFRRKAAVIESGFVDDNVYILLDGLIRIHYYSEGRDVTYGFGSPGTVFLSVQSYYLHGAAFLSASACMKSVVLVITKADMENFMTGNADIERWFHHIWMNQLAYCEKKLESINQWGVMERYERFLRLRPEIIRTVPLRDIASYLGITPEYLSRIRQKIRKK